MHTEHLNKKRSGGMPYSFYSEISHLVSVCYTLFFCLFESSIREETEQGHTAPLLLPREGHLHTHNKAFSSINHIYQPLKRSVTSRSVWCLAVLACRIRACGCVLYGVKNTNRGKTINHLACVEACGVGLSHRGGVGACFTGSKTRIGAKLSTT